MMPDRRTVIASGLMLPLLGGARGKAVIDVRDTGARGDGKALDHNAINRAIADAARGGGGTVLIPAGRYRCFSIRLRSHVSLIFGPGAVMVAADPATDGGSFDLPEPNEHDVYQDFGHSHWHNSLIWGVGLTNIEILGPGLIDGAGLRNDGPGAKWTRAGSHPVSMRGMTAADMNRLEPDRARMDGQGNKAIALKNCRNVRLDGFAVRKGGHFAILATGTDNLTIDGLRIDTDRDGIDIDACRNVQISGCAVNSPNDDAIVLKSSLALGFARVTENVTISDCTVSGFDMGTMLDGNLGRTQQLAPDRDRVTGRIKFGTESNGGFRNIAIADCVFDRCRGLALETVDGGVLEDVTVNNLTMRDVTTAPLFLRIGDRRRGPEGTGLGKLRRISIANVNASGIDHRFAATIAGLPDSCVEDVTLTSVRLEYAGGGTAADAARAVPEARDAYPEPSMFGVLPAHGLYVRHARRLRIDGLEIATAAPDARPAIIVDQAMDVRFTALRTPKPVVRDSHRVTVE